MSGLFSLYFPVIFHSKYPPFSSFLSINTQIPVKHWWWHHSHSLLSAFHPCSHLFGFQNLELLLLPRLRHVLAPHATMYKKLAGCSFIAGKCKHWDERERLPTLVWCFIWCVFFFFCKICGWKIFWKIFLAQVRLMTKVEVLWSKFQSFGELNCAFWKSKSFYC